MNDDELRVEAAHVRRRADEMLKSGLASDQEVDELYRRAKQLHALALSTKTAPDNADNGGHWTPEEKAALRRTLGEDDHDRPALGGGYAGGGLYSAIMAQGFDRKSRPDVTVSYKAATFDGSIEESNRRVTTSPALGADTRFLWPSLPTTPIDAGTTGITSFRQKGRTLATASTMIRAVDAVSTKPETGTETELLTATVKQIATVESGIPNVLLEHSQFRSFIEQDVRLAYNEAVDYHVVTEILAANPSAATVGGSNPVEVALYAAEDVRAAGYEPDVLVMSPGDTLAFTLTQLTGGDSYIRTPNLGLRLVTAKNLSDDEGFVMDSSAAGQLFLSPARLQAFEENAGKTNSSTVRFESNGLFVVQRVDAIVALAGS
jgi:hypothetical protein